MPGSQLDPRPQTYPSTLGAWEGSPPTRSVSWGASSNPQENHHLHYPLNLQEGLAVRRGPSGVLAWAAPGCLRPRDHIEKSGSWKQREQQRTTTPNMLRGADACALRAGGPCGPSAGSAAPRRAPLRGRPWRNLPRPRPRPRPRSPGPCSPQPLPPFRLLPLARLRRRLRFPLRPQPPPRRQPQPGAPGRGGLG